MSGRTRQILKQPEVSPEIQHLQRRFQEHVLKRLEEGLSHHTKVFDLGLIAFWWSFLVAYFPLTVFLIWGMVMVFVDILKLKVVLNFLPHQAFGVSFAMLFAFPLAIFISLSRYNRIDAGKEDSSKLSDYIPTSGIFDGL